MLKAPNNIARISVRCLLDVTYRFVYKGWLVRTVPTEGETNAIDFQARSTDIHAPGATARWGVGAGGDSKRHGHRFDRRRAAWCDDYRDAYGDRQYLRGRDGRTRRVPHSASRRHVQGGRGAPRVRNR